MQFTHKFTTLLCILHCFVADGFSHFYRCDKSTLFSLSRPPPQGRSKNCWAAQFGDCPCIMIHELTSASRRFLYYNMILVSWERVFFFNALSLRRGRGKKTCRRWFSKRGWACVLPLRRNVLGWKMWLDSRNARECTWRMDSISSRYEVAAFLTA